MTAPLTVLSRQIHLDPSLIDQPQLQTDISGQTASNASNLLHSLKLGAEDF